MLCKADDTLQDALHQAEWEFGVRPEEWTDVRKAAQEGAVLTTLRFANAR
jgi:hypothetical protein